TATSPTELYTLSLHDALPILDHGGSQVGLDEDEKNRPRREADRGEHRLAVADSLRPVGEHAGEEEYEEQLPELRGLELEEAEIEPELRAARDRAGEQDDHHQPERPDVDLLAVATVVLGVDKNGDDEGE